VQAAVRLAEQMVGQLAGCWCSAAATPLDVLFMQKNWRENLEEDVGVVF